MTAIALLAPPVVSLIVPPYDQVEVVPDLAALTPESLPPGAVLAAAGPHLAEPWTDVAALVAQLRARFSAAPVVIRVERPFDHDPATRQHALDLGARGVLTEGGPPRAALRTMLTDQTRLAEQILDWLALRSPGLRPPGTRPPDIRHPEIRPPVAELIREIVARSGEFGEVGPLLESMGHAERTARTWFLRAGVPGPGKWLAVSHAVRAALRLQAEEGSSLLSLAVECGYSDHSSLSRQSLRLFGVRPGAIRRTLGWEWLIDRWFRTADRGA
jgi:AraC-like DNA-binding protein